MLNRLSLFLVLICLPACSSEKRSAGKSDAPIPAAAASESAGQNGWQVQKSGVEADLLDVAFVDDRSGVAVGKKWTVLKTADGGHTWRSVGPDSTGLNHDALDEVHFGSPQQGWVISSTSQLILHTVDGGDSWQRVPLPEKKYDGTMACTGAAVGSSFYYLCWGLYYTHLYRTDDAGQKWEELNNTLKMGGVDNDTKLFFLDAKHGWYALHYNVNRDSFLGTTDDGGKTWRQQKIPTKVEMNFTFVDRDRGWVAPKAGPFLATIDGGATWNPHELPGSIGDLSFVSADVGYVVHEAERPGRIHGYEVRQTMDGGKTWKVVGDFVPTFPAPVGLAFTASGRGWVVGNKGYIAKYAEK
jgi:photosystem II stability/assembly factor-like uncharacterized protein